ncbi:MAG: hypothetical protein DMF06_03250 [Verrucomicrobia bacterium]|nr:MAG: hypothetical protein DMF06_03250 [Verrucomicrobiota bacterium]
MSNMPLITTAAITSIVGAVISVLLAFGVHLTPEQSAAIMGLITVLAPWVVALVGHNTTTPLANPTAKDGEPLVRASGDSTPPQTRSIARGG